MPFDVERQLTHRFLIGLVELMLQEKDAEHGVQFFGGTTHARVKRMFDRVYRQFAIQKLAEQIRPPAFQHLFSFGTQKLKGIQEGQLYIGMDSQHRSTLTY